MSAQGSRVLGRVGRSALAGVAVAAAAIASGCSLALDLTGLDDGRAAAAGSAGAAAGGGSGSSGSGGGSGSSGSSGSGGSGGGSGSSGSGGGGGSSGSGGSGGGGGSGGSSGGGGGSGGSSGATPGVPIDLATGQKTPTGIGLDATHVYWVNTMPPAIFRVLKSGAGKAETLVTAVDLMDPRDVAVDGGTLYWSEGKGNLVRSKAISGGAAVDVASGAGRVAYLAIGGGKLYATDDRTDMPTQGSISFMTLGSNKLQVLFDTEPLATGIALDGSTLAWATAGTINLGKADGSNEGALVPANGTVSGVAVDASNVYWISAAMRILTAPVGGGSSTTYFDPPGSLGAGDVSVDADFVYWTEPDTGRVRKMLK